MFSKKISNDENGTHPKLKNPKIVTNNTDESNMESFWSRRKSCHEAINKNQKLWINANKSLYKKYKIIVSIVAFLGFGGFFAMWITGEVQIRQYRINYDQNWKLIYLSGYAKNAIPLFERYTSLTPPASISPNTVSAIDSITVYLKKFQYINDLSDTKFTIANFNIWVQRYQQWPQQLNDGAVLETKDKYVATLNTLVEKMTTRENPAIPLVEMNSMSNFAHSLKEIDMNIYASIKWYENAKNLTYYCVIPLTVTTVIIGVISFLINSKQKEWFRQHESELNAQDESAAK